MRAHELVDRLCDEAAVPEVSRTADLLFARATARLFDQALVRRRDTGALEQRARLGRRQEDRGRARPLRSEDVLDLSRSSRVIAGTTGKPCSA